MLTREEKTKVIEGLQERFRRQRMSIFTDIRGISVAKLSAFRRELRKLGAELKVTKKTLLRRALQASGPALSGIEPKELDGEIGVIFGYDNQVTPAKAAAKFAKENQTFKVLRGVLESKVLAGMEVLALAKLPSREQLLAQLAVMLNAPIQGLVNTLQGNIRNLVGVLNKIKETRD